MNKIVAVRMTLVSDTDLMLQEIEDGFPRANPVVLLEITYETSGGKKDGQRNMAVIPVPICCALTILDDLDRVKDELRRIANASNL